MNYIPRDVILAKVNTPRAVRLKRKDTSQWAKSCKKYNFVKPNCLRNECCMSTHHGWWECFP